MSDQEIIQVAPSQNQEPRITKSEKSGKKNPGRVEAGKRLAQWSREARKKGRRAKSPSKIVEALTYLTFLLLQD